jgi:cytochrome P450
MSDLPGDSAETKSDGSGADDRADSGADSDTDTDPLADLDPADPYPAYADVRARLPVHRAPGGWWRVLRHADAVEVLTDAARFSSRTRQSLWPHAGRQGAVDRLDRDGTIPLSPEDSPALLFTDPPRHTHLRRLVEHVFTDETLKRVAGGVRADAAALVARLRVLTERAESVDLVTELAEVLPAAALARTIGVPAAVGPRLVRWAGATDTFADVPVPTGPSDSTAAMELGGYVDRLVSARERAGPTPDGDLLDELLVARESDGGLDRTEVCTTVALMISAGHTATVNLLGNALHALLRHPDQLALLSSGSVPVAEAVFELARYDSPLQVQRRIALADTELGGESIGAGELVLVMVGAANRDPSVFADPDRLDLRREAGSGLAFGTGAHRCVGAPLARLQMVAALEAVLPLLAGVRLHPRGPRWRDEGLLRGLAELPVCAAGQRDP